MRRFLAPPAFLGGFLLVVAAAPAADPAPAKSAPDKAARVEVPYRLTDTKHVLVRVKLNGKGPFNLILDTGAPAVFITKAVAKKAGVAADEKAEKGLVEFDRFEIEGGLVVPKAKGRVEDLFQLEGMNGMGLAGVELHGVIGYNVLAKYRVEYDFTADRLGFEELPGFEPPGFVRIKGAKGPAGQLEMLGPMMKTLAALMGIKPNFEVAPRGFVGLEYDEKDGVVVTKVLAGSPAEKAGLKAGDKIEQIRNTEIETGRSVTRALAKAGVGQRVRVTVRRDGEEVELTIDLGRGL
jgi:serine protease DegQ